MAYDAIERTASRKYETCSSKIATTLQKKGGKGFLI